MGCGTLNAEEVVNGVPALFPFLVVKGCWLEIDYCFVIKREKKRREKMERPGFERIDGPNTAKKAKRDGKRECPECNERIGIRAKQCDYCGAEMKKKEKDWEKIASDSSKDGNYIKEKLFHRMDQLSTIPGWTGVVFLIHENEVKSGQKRVFTHSYSTAGAGRNLELAMRDKVLNSMKIFLNIGKMKPDLSTSGETQAAAPSPLCTLSTSSSSLDAAADQPVAPSSLIPTNASVPSSKQSFSLSSGSSHSTAASSSQLSFPPHQQSSIPELMPHMIESSIPKSTGQAMSFHPLHSQMSSASEAVPVSISSVTFPSPRNKPQLKGTNTMQKPALVPLSNASAIARKLEKTIGHQPSTAEVAPVNTTTTVSNPSQLSSDTGQRNLPGRLIEINGHKFFILNQKSSVP